MPADRSEYQIAIKTTAEGGASIHEMREGIKLLALQAGDTLGPLGELAHFLSNPWMLAVAGGTLAVRTLIDRHKELIEAQKQGLITSQEFRDDLRGAVLQATLNASNAIADFHRGLENISADQDILGEKFRNTTALLAAQAAAAKSVAAAYQALENARITTGVDAGVTSDPQANLMRQQAAQRARKEQEEIEDQTFASEQTERANTAALERERAHQAAADHDVAQRKAITDEAAADEAKQNFARRKAAVGPMEQQAAGDKAKFDTMINELEGRGSAVPGWFKAAQAKGDVEGMKHASPELYDLLTRSQQSERAAGQARGALTAATETAARTEEAKRAADDVVANFQRIAQEAEKTAIQMEKDFAQNQRLHDIAVSGQAKTDDLADQTAKINRRNYLQEQVNQKKATPEEMAEYQGATDSGVSHRVADTRSRIAAIQDNVRLEGGVASAKEVAELVKLNDYLIGLLENVHGTTSRNVSDISNLMSRVRDLEAHGQNARTNQP